MNRLARIRNWFRTKRSLVGQLDDFEAIVAKQIDEIQELREDIRVQTRQQHAVLDHTRKLLDAHEAKNARLVDELKALHAEIRRAELADAIAQETAAKRQQDGLGDPA